MSRIDVPASTLHRAIADVAEFLERYTAVDTELQIVNSAWTWMTAQDRNVQPKD